MLATLDIPWSRNVGLYIFKNKFLPNFSCNMLVYIINIHTQSTMIHWIYITSYTVYILLHSEPRPLDILNSNSILNHDWENGLHGPGFFRRIWSSIKANSPGNPLRYLIFEQQTTILHKLKAAASKAGEFVYYLYRAAVDTLEIRVSWIFYATSPKQYFWHKQYTSWVSYDRLCQTCHQMKSTVFPCLYRITM